MAFAEIASDLKLFETLAADAEKEWKVEELAEQLDADPVLLRESYSLLTRVITTPDFMAKTAYSATLPP
jgi:hypothetical protein